MTASEVTGSHNDLPEKQSDFATVSHVSKLENAFSILKNGSIDARLEHQRRNPLTGTGLEVIWFSPNDWQNHKPNTFGCIAFEFNLNYLLDYYGRHVYGLGRADYRMGTNRFLLSNSAHHAFGIYDAKREDAPWQIKDNRHYRKQSDVLHFAVEASYIPLDALVGIRFVDHQGGMKNGNILHLDTAARLFLARLVGEQAPSIPQFCGLRLSPDQVTDEGANCLFEGFTTAVTFLFDNLQRNYLKFIGTVTENDPMASILARAVLDRLSRMAAIGPYDKKVFDDAHQLASCFATQPDFLNSVRRVVAEWAGIDDSHLRYL